MLICTVSHYTQIIGIIQDDNQIARVKTLSLVHHFVMIFILFYFASIFLFHVAVSPKAECFIIFVS